MVARHLEIPLMDVLRWPMGMLEEEIARVLLHAAHQRAQQHFRDETEPPTSDTDLLTRAARALLVELKAAKTREDAAASDAALDALEREG